MHFDALTLAAVRAELQVTLRDGRVQQVLAPDEQSIGLEIYAGQQRHYLLLSGDPQNARIHLAQQKLRRGVEQASPLLQLLRKYLRGSLLATFTQPDPTERLLTLHFSHPEHGQTQLVIELLGQRSNLLLLNEQGKIMNCLHRLRPSEPTGRTLLPNQPYVLPARQAKLAPLDDGAPDYYERLGQVVEQDGLLWRALVAAVAGVSPSQARELAWRAGGDVGVAARAVNVLALAQALQSLWGAVATGAWQPGVWQEGNALVGFSPYQAHVRGEFVPTATISQALERYYTQQQSVAVRAMPQHDSYAALRGNVAALLRAAQGRVARQLAALAGDEPAPGEADALRTQAEWLLALSSQIVPGQSQLAVDLGDTQLIISLVANKSPIEQAEQLFHRAAKFARAAAIIPQRRAKLLADQAFLEQLSHDLSEAEGQPAIAAIQDELRTTGLSAQLRETKGHTTPKGPKLAQPFHYYSPQGFEIVVGRNARQNDEVTFGVAKGDDLWLHARGAPGAHVVIRSGGQAVWPQTLTLAAQLAAYHSKLRGERAATVIVTPRRYVSRAPGGHPGQVIVRQEETVTVAGELPADLVEKVEKVRKR